MRIGFGFQDTHGEDSRFVEKIGDTWRITAEGIKEVDKVRDNGVDVLVILGDFGEGAKAQAYKGLTALRALFTDLRDHCPLLHTIILVTGNHCHFIKQSCMDDLGYKNNPERKPEYYIPCVIDQEKISLPRLGEDKIYDIGWLSDKYEGFNWIVADDVTINKTFYGFHGHQSGWWGEVAHALLYIATGREKFDDIDEFYEYMNAPLLLASKVIGSAGRFTEGVGEFEEAWLLSKFKLSICLSDGSKQTEPNPYEQTIMEYLKRATTFIDRKTNLKWYKEIGEAAFLKKLREYIMKLRGKADRGNKRFLNLNPIHEKYLDLLSQRTEIIVHGHTHNDPAWDPSTNSVDLGATRRGCKSALYIVDTITNEGRMV